MREIGKRIKMGGGLALILIMLLAAGLAQGAAPTATPAPQAVQATVSTPSGPLNMRRAASNSSGIMARIPNKETVTVLSYDGEWAKVKYKTYTGYVKRSFLVAAEAAGISARKFESLLYPGLPITFIRKEPSEDAEIIGQMFPESYFTVLSRDGEWAKIKFLKDEKGNDTGYVLTSTLKPATKEEEEASPSRHTFVYAVLKSDQPVYGKAASSAEVIGSMAKGAVVEVLYAMGSWSDVCEGSMQGWVKTGALEFTKEKLPRVNGGTVQGHVASYYTATTRDRIVQLYNNPTTATADNHLATLRLGERDRLMVLIRGFEAGEMVWSKVSDGTYVGWTPAGGLTLSDQMETYTYKQTIGSGAAGVAYAKEDGVKVYDGYPEDAPVLRTLRKGEEITIQLTVSQDFVAVLRGGAYYGNVRKSEITMGLIDAEAIIAKENPGNAVARNVVRGTPAPRKSYDGMTQITKGEARDIGERALAGKYGGFAGASAYTVTSSFHDNEPTQFEQPYWQFDYLAPRTDHPDLKIVKFTVMVHAYTKKVIYTTEGWEADLTEINYSTPTPAPVYSDGDKKNPLSREDAISIGQSALKKKYSKFDPSAYTLSAQYVETSFTLEAPYWMIYYLDSKGNGVYSVYVHAYTRKVLYTGGPDNVNG